MVGVVQEVTRGLAVALVVFLAACSSSGRADLPKGAPAPPSNVQLLSEKDALQVSWDCTPGVTGYTVFWGNQREEYRNLHNTDRCSLALEGLKKGRFYAVAVTAWNHRGQIMTIEC